MLLAAGRVTRPGESTADHLSQEVELIFVEEFGGYIFKCDGVWVVFVVEKKAVSLAQREERFCVTLLTTFPCKWFLVKLLPVCPPAPPKEDTKKHGYARRDDKKDPHPNKKRPVTVTVTNTQTAVSTQTITVEPPCLPAKCQLPQFHKSEKGDDDYWYIIDEKGKWQVRFARGCHASTSC